MDYNPPKNESAQKGHRLKSRTACAELRQEPPSDLRRWQMSSELDPFVNRKAVRTATTLSFPTISRMQRRGEFPQFEQISPGRRGIRRSTLAEFLAGRRDWG